MKSLISQDGTIGNSGDIQPDGLGFPALNVLGSSGAAAIDPGVGALSFVGGTEQSPAAGEAGGGPAAFIIGSSAGQASNTSDGGAAFAPLVISPVFDASVTGLGSTPVGAAPSTAQYETAINAAIAYYDSNYTSDILVGTNVNGTIVSTVTVQISFGYGTIGTTGTTVAANDAAESTWTAGQYFGTGSYTDLSGDLTGVLPNLPAVGTGADQVPGSTPMFETTAEADVLGGANSGTASTVGNVGISSAVTFAWDPANQSVGGDYGAVGATEHEIAEIFGRVSFLNQTSNVGSPPGAYSVFDLYRFSSSGTLARAVGTSDYFSLDSGNTVSGHLNQYGMLVKNGTVDVTGTLDTGDAGDWVSAGPNNVVNDSSDAFLPIGVGTTISSFDTLALESIGLKPVCYLEGTRILTTTGEKRVENLSIGDELPTLLGGPGRVIWLGRRTMDLTRHPKPFLAWPVRVRAGAFAPGLPMRDLYLSPDHAVYSGGVLIPVKLLINGSSVHQVERDHVVYHHVELEQHDVIQAEGLPCESYMDAGDRDTFSGGVVTTLYPEFSARRWEMAGCAPLVLAGPELDAVRLRLAVRGGLSAADRLAAAQDGTDQRRARPPLRRIARAGSAALQTVD